MTYYSFERSVLDVVVREPFFSSAREGDFQNLVKSLISSEALVVTEYSRDLLPLSFYWIGAKFKFGNVTISSSGEGFDKSIAIRRAVAECLERVVVFYGSKGFQFRIDANGYSDVESTVIGKLGTSNGIAYSLDPALAVTAAFRELIERQVILFSWLNHSLLGAVPNNFLNSIREKVWQLATNTHQRIFSFPNDFGLHIIGTAILSKKGRSLVFGYGCNVNFDLAMQKSKLEAWRFIWNQERLFSGKLTTEASGGDRNLFADHIDAYKDGKIEFGHTFNFENKAVLAQSALKSPTAFEVNLIPLEQFGLVGWTAQVSANNFIELWTGPLKSDFCFRKSGEWHPIF